MQWITDIFLLKLKKLQSKGYNVFFAGYEKILKKSVKNTSISIWTQIKKSAEAENIYEIYNFLKDQDYDFLLQVNACMPYI